MANSKSAHSHPGNQPPSSEMDHAIAPGLSNLWGTNSGMGSWRLLTKPRPEAKSECFGTCKKLDATGLKPSGGLTFSSSSHTSPCQGVKPPQQSASSATCSSTKTPPLALKNQLEQQARDDRTRLPDRPYGHVHKSRRLSILEVLCPLLKFRPSLNVLCSYLAYQ